MSFFSKFPKIDYDVNLTGVTQKLIDFSRVVDVNDVLSIDSTSYTKYTIIDGARPDIVSQLLYDTPDYYWTFFILNDHLKSGYHMWPKGEVALNKYIDEKYKNTLILTIPTKRGSGVNNTGKYGSFADFPLNEFVTVYDLDNPTHRAYFKSWNTDTYQAVFEKTDPNHFSNKILTIGYPEFVNPYNVFTFEYEQTEIKRKIWNQEVYDYYSSIPGSQQIINEWVGNTNNMSTLNEGSEQWYQSFVNYIKEINFTAHFINDTPQFANPKLAPRYYTNTNGDQVSAFEAFYPNDNVTLSESPFATGDYKTNYEAEVENNDNLSQIKIVRPDRISEFSNRFKALLNE